MNAGEEDKSNGGARQVLKVLGEGATTVKAGDGAFNSPALGRDRKASCLDSLNDDALPVGNPARIGDEFRVLKGAITDDGGEERESSAHRLVLRHRAAAILDISGMELLNEAAAVRVDQRMTLAAHDLLAGVIATWTTGFGRSHALAVDNGGGRTGRAVDTLAVGHDQGVVDL